jgi:hypothetical protein
MRIVLACVLALTVWAVSARAESITASAFLAGTHQVEVGSTTVSAWTDTAATAPGTFGLKTQSGVTGVGVQGGGSSGEIDYVGGKAVSESLKVEFDSPRLVTSLSVGLLFNGPEYGDGSEVVHVIVGDVIGRLTAVAEDLALWEIGGLSHLLGSCSPLATLLGGSGCFKVMNPFNGRAVSGFSLAAGRSGAANESDFALVELSSAPAIPEPASIALTAAALAGLAASRRRRRRSLDQDRMQ